MPFAVICTATCVLHFPYLHLDISFIKKLFRVGQNRTVRPTGLSSYQQKEEAIGNIKTAAMIQTCDA